MSCQQRRGVHRVLGSVSICAQCWQQCLVLGYLATTTIAGPLAMAAKLSRRASRYLYYDLPKLSRRGQVSRNAICMKNED